MKLSRFWKIAIGGATAFAVIAPFLMFPLMFLPWFFVIASTEGNGPDPNAVPPFFILGFFVFFVFIMLYALVHLALQVFYFIHLMQSDQASKSLRTLFGIGIFFMPYFGMPVYYFTYLWPESPPDWALEPRATAPARKAKP